MRERGGAGLYRCGNGIRREVDVDGWGSGVRKRRGGRARWMGEGGEGEKKGQIWMNGGVE